MTNSGTNTAKRALIIGGSTGSGRAIAIQLSQENYEVFVVARNEERLAALKAENEAIETIALDAAQDGVADSLLKDLTPNLLILAGGNQPVMAPFQEQSWEDFSATWNCDTKMAYDFSKAALKQPLPQGTTIISFSSGASLNGSSLSGGYAGAKRMQHFLVNYAQGEANRLGLGLTFISMIPKQLMTGTDIGATASESYAATVGKTAEQFMSQWEKPLTPAIIADCVLDIVKNGPKDGANAFTITGQGLEIY